MQLTRRAWLGAVGAAGIASLAGCGGSSGESTPEPTVSGPQPPTAERSLMLGHEIETLSNSLVSGGVSKDGIPSIDEPTFVTGETATLDDGEPVFGVVRGDDVKAYPQYILTFHEIVNDELDGDPVAVTYCPLTGTVQGFERGAVEFGVSGRLVNSNLTMYDRGTDSWWPQLLATAVRGPLIGETLQEFRVIWTTWGEWKATHPETELLTEDTGYTRRYGDDPYGSYNPRGGYYESDDTLFEPLESDDRAAPKRVVIGTRTADGALVFDKETLLAERVLTGQIGGTQYVAVAEESLSTAYVYVNPDGLSVEAASDGYRVDGETHAADALPLDRSLAFDGMWFAWAGFYPGVTYVR